jgi:autotransporter-associated beta strand protein
VAVFFHRINLLALWCGAVSLASAQTPTDGTIFTQSSFNWSAAPWTVSGAGSYPGDGGIARFNTQVNTIAGTVPTGSTLTLDVPVTLSGLTFESISPYTIAGGSGSLTLSSTGLNTLNVIRSSQSSPTLLSIGHLIAAPIGGGGAFGLTKTGAGILTLSGVNTYTGGTVINAGTLNISSGNSALGATGPGNDVSMNGGTLRISTTALTTARNFSLGTEGGTLELFATATINGAISGSGSLTQRGMSVLTLTGANSYTGATTIGIGSLILSGSAGSIAASSSYDLLGVVSLNNTSANNNNRLRDAGTITSRGGVIMLTGNSSAATSETAGPLLLASGFTTIDVTPDASQQASFDLPSMHRLNTGTLFVRGTNLGGTPGNGVAQITSASVPGLLIGGGGAAGSTNISILPWATGNTSTSTTLGSSFVTYDAATGRLRPLATTEYLSSLPFSTATSNVRLTGNTVAPANSSVNALLLAPTSSHATLSGGVIAITSGSFLYSPTANFTGTVSAGLNFGTAEGIISATNTLNVTGVISGSGGLTINPLSVPGGATTITLSGASTYTGTTTLLGGFLQYSGTITNDGSAGPFGTDTSAIVLNPGATVTRLFATASSTLNRDLSIQGSGGNLVGLGTTADFKLTINGNIDLQRSLTLEGGTTAANAMTINGAISGPGSLADGFSTYVILNGNNTYSGGTNIGTSNSLPTYVAGTDTAFGTGVISFSAAGRIQGSGTTARTLANDLFLAANPTFQGAAPLTFTGSVNLNGNRTISITNTAGTVFAGGVSSGSLTKIGSGSLALSNSTGNSYTGGTVLGTNAGTLLVGNTSGSATGTGALFIGTGSTLAGTGFIDSGTNPIAINGTLSAGSTAGSPGTIHLASGAGALTLSSTSVLRMDLGAASDLIALTATNLVLSGGALQLNLGAGFDYTTTYTLFSGATGVTGSFSVVTGYDFANYAPTFTFSEGDYALSFTAVPEPGTWAAGLLVIALLAFHQRKRIFRTGLGRRRFT